MAVATVNAKGQIVIPAKLRKRRGLKKGSRVLLEENGDDLVLKTVDQTFFDGMSGSLKTGGRLSNKLLEERESERRQEGS